ncbi:glycosyl transferase family 39 : PMT family glycosyltransferase, 4-amino-4-deoxy-L-arabinose transferase OS=Singulisphaera acidiphila (strain ATCC BAA-1392 / DSM 18658 / VKM B-2454 / MOB10) GN=Sinac_0121 PE=4 SV=1: PMT [Gemmata massiliana]|uniref:ArnT-like N-terminal domain-containing protein n=1 Tax=Gemmata massiliana TaxID=1210884 RepID=A0A6P2CXC4_9BACT|nr:phospholipid carrier-dependent glycosyltransferase [Gemmata massiliana]VTR91752.1 glycosyl transferase family 39 : PMT family glycosyltransferase, 4-amino-4-deoxy-L-arabinose transferase OS=Singulisphaera acidiphila (strain ATCC BAA-1392 / DSM 18658 / VKM B-2454 / MOB10) GN=Sinac_0121 PE=4 SV=1: PMT [Gemmata massiliana]
MTENSLSYLTRRDYALLAAFCFALFSFCALFAKTLTGHESVVAQNSREMLAGGDWIVPRVGGEPWLERPPASAWFICAVYAVAGTSTSDAVARLAAVLIAVPLVLLVARTGALFYGRNAGLAAGGIFATMHEFYGYASNPEADIFLCLIVTATVAAFAQLEFGPRASRVNESGSFFGSRPLLVLAFFALLGATNLAKGVIFGTVMAGLPIAGYLLWNRSWGQLKRYVWLWGWLAAAGVALAWPIAVISRHPEIIDLWRDHYLNRLNKGYLQEPWWYYAVNVPFVLLPWTLPALVGLWQTRRAAFAGPGPERFLWCWAILPPLVFSASDGKHHHYLLQCMAPWAILSVGGAVAMWSFARDRMPGWVRNPWAWAGLVGCVAVWAAMKYRGAVGAPEWLLVSLAVSLPLLTFAFVRFANHTSQRAALVGVLLVFAVAYSEWTYLRAATRDAYAPDTAMLHRTPEFVPSDAPIYVQYDWLRPLETFWVLYHTPQPGTLVRDPWDLKEKSGGRASAFILARRQDAEQFAVIGSVEPLLESEKTRLEPHAGYRRTLYRVTFHATAPPAPPEVLAESRRTLW